MKETRLVDVCINLPECTCITDMYIIANGYCMRNGCYQISRNSDLVGWLVGFVALRPKSTAMVIAGWSVHLTTLFPGQA